MTSRWHSAKTAEPDMGLLSYSHSGVSVPIPEGILPLFNQYRSPGSLYKSKMTHSLRLHGILCLAFFGSVISSSAVAETLPASLDFGLHLSRLDTSLHSGQQDINTTVKQLGIVSFDIRQQPLRPGLAVGYASVSDSNQAVTAGMELVGFYIAPALRGVLVDGRWLTATLTATYLYQRVKDSNATQDVTQEWQQQQLDLDVKCHITRQMNLLLGGRYGRIDVDERISGGVNQNLTLQAGPTLGYRAGLEFNLEGEGQVGMFLHRAIGDGIEIYFQQQF